MADDARRHAAFMPANLYGNLPATPASDLCGEKGASGKSVYVCSSAYCPPTSLRHTSVTFNVIYGHVLFLLMLL